MKNNKEKRRKQTTKIMQLRWEEANSLLKSSSLFYVFNNIERTANDNCRSYDQKSSALFFETVYVGL